MAHSYEIVPAKPVHLSMIARTCRADDRAEIEAAGQTPRHLMYKLYQKSFIARAGFVDGELAAVWGCTGSLLSSVGQMWLLTAPPIERIPIAFAKEARAMIREVLQHKRTLVSGCVDGYEKSLRLWSMLGFEIGEAVAVPPHGAMFRRLTMERTHGV